MSSQNDMFSLQIDQSEKLIKDKNQETVKYQNKCKLICIILGLCLSPFYYGYSLTYLSSLSNSIIIETFGEQFNKGYVKGLLYGCITIGAAIGAAIAPSLMRIFTTKNFVMTINIMAFIVGIVLQYPNLYVLFIGRVLQGVFFGNFMAIIPIYINELVPIALRGSLGVLTQLFAIIGKVFCYALGLVLYLSQPGDQFTWRFLFGFTNFTIVIQMILFIIGFIPDTPNSLLLYGNEDQAYEILSLFTKEEYLEEVKLEKQFEVAAAKRTFLSNTQIKTLNQQKPEQEKLEKDFPKSSQTIQQQQTVKIGWKAYLVGFNLPFMQQMTGANAIIVQAGQIVSIYNQSLGIYTPLIINSVQLLATLAATKVIQLMGRRKNILFGNFGLATCDVFIAVFFIFAAEWAPAITIIFVILLIYMVIYGISVGPAVWLYVPQILPPKMVPYATVLNWIGCSICIIFLPIVTQACNNNPFPIFFFFAVWSYGAYVINHLFMVETKGLTTKQIYQKYN